MRLITCTCAGEEKSAFQFFPGSAEARANGCTCPPEQVKWPKAVHLDAACRLHRLEHVRH